MKKFLTKHVFWVLQILGWGSLGLFVIAVNNSAKNNLVFLVTLFGFMVVGIGITSITGWFFRRFVNLKEFKTIDFFKILLIVILTSLLFPFVSYWSGYGLGKAMRWIVEDGADLFEKPKERYHWYEIRQYVGYMVIVTGWTVFYFVIKVLRQANNQRVNRLELQKKVKQAQLNTLKGHINPQFMFTSLNNIKGLMLEDVSKSRNMLTKLSEMLRYSLTKNNVDTVLLEEELEMVENYVSLLQIQYQDRFQIQYTIQKEALKMEIPPMLVHNVVEHASKNGILMRREGGEIILKAIKEQETIQIAVAHSGSNGNTKEADQLKNKLTHRLRLMYGETAQFLEDFTHEGTRYLITLPLKPLNRITEVAFKEDEHAD